MKRYYIIPILLIIGLFLGIKTNEYNIGAHSYKEDKHGDINILIYNNADKDCVDRYLEDVKSLPEFLSSFDHKIIFQKDDIDEIDGIDGTILLCTQGNETTVCTKYYDSSGIVHEMFHALDYKKNFISNKKEFMDLYEKYHDDIQVSQGNVDSVEEFFASAGEMYIKKPEELFNTGKDLFVYYENLEKASLQSLDCSKKI